MGIILLPSDYFRESKKHYALRNLADQINAKSPHDYQSRKVTWSLYLKIFQISMEWIPFSDYFLFFNMAFCLFVCFPLLYLSVFVAQNSQVNVVTIFGNHGRAYQGICSSLKFSSDWLQGWKRLDTRACVKHLQLCWNEYSDLSFLTKWDQIQESATRS